MTMREVVLVLLLVLVCPVVAAATLATDVPFDALMATPIGTLGVRTVSTMLILAIIVSGIGFCLANGGTWVRSAFTLIFGLSIALAATIWVPALLPPPPSVVTHLPEVAVAPPPSVPAVPWYLLAALGGMAGLGAGIGLRWAWRAYWQWRAEMLRIHDALLDQLLHLDSAALDRMAEEYAQTNRVVLLDQIRAELAETRRRFPLLWRTPPQFRSLPSGGSWSIDHPPVP